MHVTAFCNQGCYPSHGPGFLSHFNAPPDTLAVHSTWQILTTQKGTSATTSRIANSSTRTQYSACVCGSKWSLPFSLSSAVRSHTCYPSKLTRTVSWAPLFPEDSLLASYNCRSCWLWARFCRFSVLMLISQLYAQARVWRLSNQESLNSPYPNLKPPECSLS